MAITSPHDGHAPTDAGNTSAVPVPALVILVAALAAAWIAAGSMGLLGHSLRHALTWVALTVAIVAGWPRRDPSITDRLILAGAVVLGVILTTPWLPAVNVLAVAVVAAALARSQTGLGGRVILIAATAIAVLGVFRLACSSIPAVWLAADAAGWVLGRSAGWLVGKPLWVGASFGGVDFLVLMAALSAGWLICSTPPRLPRAVYAAAAILGGHLLYLTVLAFSDKLLAALPDVVVPELLDVNQVGAWAWGNSVRSLVPWNLPVLAGLIHATIAVWMFRWAAWLPAVEAVPPRNTTRKEETGFALLIDAVQQFGPALLAVVIPILTVLGLSESGLKGKTVVAYDQGFLDWQKPEHDTEGTGRYGMLPVFVESLGGRFVRSPDLSPNDLAEADVLLLLHPNRPWPEATLNRVRQFVRDEGLSVLLVAEPRRRSGGFESTFNDVLEPTAMWVRYDTAVAAATGWEQCCDPSFHPSAAGIDDLRNRFGLRRSSSIRTRWPARPILIGRFGFSEPGSDAANTRGSQYQPGEKLGDLVLAAEQRVGKGRIVVLGDAWSLHNDGIANCYPFAGRLLGYLAGRSASPQDLWRQLLGLLAVIALVGLLAWQGTAQRTAIAAAVLGISVVCCSAASHGTARVLPDGRTHKPNNLAYIDASHLEAYSSDTWNNFGTGGLARTLMRNGYLPLLLPELTPERLEPAGLLISIAPARPFSETQRAAVHDFVAGGGTFLCMAGGEDVAASREMLADFDFRVPPSPVPPGSDAREPCPLGKVRTLYINLDDHQAAMESYASWEVECRAENQHKMAQWSDGVTDRPFIVSQRVGRGAVAVIGDTYLAVNQNLESAVNTMPENMAFWRWFLTRITDQEEWTPPKKTAAKAPFEELPPETPAEGDPPEKVPAEGDPADRRPANGNPANGDSGVSAERKETP